MRTKTLKVLLFKNLAWSIIFALLIIGGAGYWSASEEIAEVYDSQLITAANVLWLVNREDKPSNEAIKMLGHNIDLSDMDQIALDEYAKWRSFRIWRNGQLVMFSDNALSTSIPPSPKGFANVIIDKKLWRLFALYIPNDKMIVEVAEDTAAREDIISNIVSGLLWPLLFAFPVIAFLIWRGISLGLKELYRFASDIKKRSPDDLSRLTNEDAPGELLPLMDGINQLLGKLESSLAQERLFTDNAAHELRTPLAALQVQTQVILNSSDNNQRAEALSELAKGTKRVSRLLDQLLTLAHLRHLPLNLISLNLYMEAGEAIKASYHEAAKKNIEIDLSGNEALRVTAQKELLQILMSNIIDNAIKYTPYGGTISLHVAQIGTRPALMITDTGSGIPEEESQKVFQRFYRLPNNVQAGSGLGLAICKQISDILQIDINLGSATDHGLTVKLSFNNK